jgi:hypothetical protein
MCLQDSALYVLSSSKHEPYVAFVELVSLRVLGQRSQRWQRLASGSHVLAL